MAFSRLRSAQLSGLGASSVMIETDIARGLYLFQIVGLPDKAVEEARERVIAALRNNIGKNPKTENQKVTISLSPAELKKEGAYFDVGIAIGYLVAIGEIPPFEIERKAFIGELALNGEVRAVKGLLSIALWAKENGITELYIPKENEREASLVEGVTFYLVSDLAELVSHLKGEEGNALQTTSFLASAQTKHTPLIDFGEVRGQEAAKRALTIAAAGAHNIVLYGPPGTGKTMLARAFHSILPTLGNNDFLEVATIYSSIGLIDDVMARQAPLRAPHHSASHVAIIGGGQHIRPGDISLAHQGVLYMDEFPEFDRRVIEALREPLEEGYITVARAKGSVRFPARFILLAAMNPCPCGYRGSTTHTCRCNAAELARYNKKLSGPVMDRIDLWVPVTNIEYETLHEAEKTAESAAIAITVTEARRIQQQKRKKLNSALTTSELQQKISLTEDAKKHLQQFANRFHLSPRSYLRTIKVAQTIADLGGSSCIDTPHILEALQYRPKID